MKNRFVAFNLLLLIVLPVFVCAQSLEGKLEEINAYARRVQKDWNMPEMAIAVVKDFGVQRIGDSDKVDEITVFAFA